MPNPTPLTRDTILAHERLYPRLASLLKQVERVAAQRPAQPVPIESLKLARELCLEAVQLLGRAGRGIAVPRAAAGTLDHATLAVALGQALAGIEAFEAEHSGHSKKLDCAVWEVDGPPLPVTRLLPKGHGGKQVEAEDPQTSFYRREVTRMILSRFSAGYDAGYKAASEGRPPSADYAERVWDADTEREAGVDKARREGLPPPRVRYTNPPRALVPKGAKLSDPKERNRWP